MRGRSSFKAVVGKQSGADADPLRNRLLGIIESLNADIAELQTLFAWNAQSGEWIDLPEKPRAIWPAPDAQLTEGILCAFSLESAALDQDGAETENPPSFQVRLNDNERPVIVAEARFERSIEKEPRKARRPSVQLPLHSRALQNAERILEDSFLDLEAIRRRYFLEGVELSFVPQPQVYLAVRDRLAIGPVALIRNGAGRWRVDEALDVSILQPLTTSLYQGVDVKGIRRYPLKPHATPPLRVAMADFRPDEQLARDYLSRVTEEEAAPVSGRDFVRSLRDTLAEAEATEEGMLTLYRLFRIEDAAERLLETDRMRTEVTKRFLTIPAVQALLDDETEAARRTAEARVEVELAERRAAADAELADAMAGLNTAREARDSALEEARKAEADVERRRLEMLAVQSETDALGRQLEGARSEIARLQGDLSAETEARIANIAASVTERVLSAGVRVSDAGGGVDPIPPPRYPVGVPASAGEIEDGPEALSRLRKRLIAAGIQERAAAPFLAALITRMSPIVIGPAALPALDAVGDALFGGRILRRTVSALTVEFGELFGRVHPASPTYRPDPDRLADLLLTAQEDEAYHLVVFDGFNRSDPDAVFTPILDPSARRSGKRLPILHPNDLRPEDPYARLAEATWPERFVPVYRYTPGAARPPALMLINSATVFCELSEREPTQVGRRTVLSAHGWASLREAASARLEEAGEVLGSGVIPADLRRAAASVGAGAVAQSLFCAALLACGTGSSEAAALTKDCLLVPPLLLTGQDVPSSDEQDVRRYRMALEGL